jgi:hypothetical protein
MFGKILGGISAVSGLLDKGGKVQSSPTSGYETYPKWLKDIFEKTAAPAIMESFNKPYEVLPMARYEADPNDPFTSKALLEMQAYSDASGGFFKPYASGQNALGGSDAAAQQAAAQQAAAMQKMREEMAAQAWLSQQMAQQMPNTRKMQQLQGVKNMSGLGEMLAAYEQGTGGKATRLDDLSAFTGTEPDLYETYRGIYA